MPTQQHFLAPELLENMVSAVTLIDHGRRADANETLLVANALTAAAIQTIGTIYPDLVARQVANVNGAIDPGDDNYTWHRLDEVGMADYVANMGDDIPLVDAYVMEQTGKVKHLATAFQYTTQDIRRMAAARKNGRQAPATLDVNKLAICDRVMERKKDDIFAFGDIGRQLPGMLTSVNVTQVDAAASTHGTNTRSWMGPDKTGDEILQDMLASVTAVVNQSKGFFQPNKFLLPIDRYRKAASTIISEDHNTGRTVLLAFLENCRLTGLTNMQVYAWDKCLTADAGNPRGMCGYFDDMTLQLIDPLALTPTAPQPNNLAFKVPCEARCGGTVIYQPLAFVYLDQL